MEPVRKGDVALDMGNPSCPPNQRWFSGTEASFHTLPGAEVWIGLPRSSKALLGISGAHALAAIICACSLFWQGELWLDAALILATSALSLALLADAFAQENAYQLLASLGTGCLLGGSQLAVLLATNHGDNRAATASGAACLALQACSALLARPAYRSFGWRMYSRIAANWRLRPSQQQQQRARQLSKQHFAALAKLDAVLLALLLVVAGIGAANPGASSAAQQPQPVGLLVGAAAAAGALLPAWLAACVAAGAASMLATSPRRRRRLAAAVDLLYPLCYVPPLLIIFAGADRGEKLAQPHAGAYLVLYPILFLAARTATWWACRRLLGSCTAQDGQDSGASRQCVAAGSSGATAQEPEPTLPAELLPLLRGAWAQKLPSTSGAAYDCLEAAGTAAAEAEKSGESLSCRGGGGCSQCRLLGAAAAAGCGGGVAPRQRFFQLSADGAALRWSWDRWILMPHVRAVHCCDESLSIRLALLLEPDLGLRFATRQQYADWAAGLRLLLALLLQPDDPLQRHSPAGSARHSSSMGREVVLQIAGGAAGTAAGAGSSQEAWPTGAASAREAAAVGSGLHHATGDLVRRALTVSTGRICTRSSSHQHLQVAAKRSQAVLAAAVSPSAPANAAGGALQRRSSSEDGRKQQQQQQGGGLQRTATISLVASASLPSVSEPALQASFKLTNSEGAADLPCSAHTPSQAVQPRQRPWQRLRSGLRQLWRGGSGASSDGSASASASGSPSRQPLCSGGRLQPSSSSGDLPATSLDQQGQAGQEQSTAQEEQPGPTQQSQKAESAGRRHERVPTLKLWAEGRPQQGEQQQQLVPPLDLGQLAGGGGGGGAGPSESVRSQGSVSLSLAPAQAGGDGSSQDTAARARPTPRLLLHGPFIHLQVALAGPAPSSRLGDLAQHPGSGGDRSAGPPDSVTPGPSVAGSEASTPAHPSAAGSPLRGSPSRQQQLRRFSLYLQQQLALQQQGGFGSASPGGSSSRSGIGSGAQTPARSLPAASPKGKGSDASLVALAGAAGGEAAPGEPGSSSSAVAALGFTRSTPAAALNQPSSGRSGAASRLSQQQLSARIAGAGAAAWPSCEDPSASGRSSVDGGTSAPPSGLPGWPGVAGSWPLARAESTFSSWGLPTPTTAKTTPFTGLSRFNSLVPSLAHTPLATSRQHPAFAPGLQQPSMHAHPALLAGLHTAAGSAWTGGWHGNGAAGQGQQRSSRRRDGSAAAADDGRRRSGEGPEGQEEEEGDASPGRSGSPGGMSLTAALPGLGISVPVEMVQFSDLVFGKLLGEGSEGAVYAAWHRETPVAVKRTRSLMELEMNLHAGSHDNIVQLRGLCSQGPDLYLVMELCPRGTLDVLIHKGHIQPGSSAAAALGAPGPGSHRLDPLKLLPIVRSVARGMLHLHTRRPAIFHRDLKPGNLFIGHGGVVKIGDFGMSRYAESWRREEREGALERTLTPGVIGTAAFSAPELLNPDSPSEAHTPSPQDEQRILKADVFSFGVTLYELLERKRPFSGMDGFQIQTQWYLDPESMRLPPPTIPEGASPAARQILETLAGLVEACTRWDPDARPTFQQILATLRTCSVPGGSHASASGVGAPGAGGAAPSPTSPACAQAV